MNKKMMLAAACGVALFSLAACGGKDIATWKGGSLTQADFYDSAKTNSTNQSLVRELIVYDVFEAAYGDKVKDSEVDAKFNEVKKQQGDNFASALQQAGLTEASYKEKVKDQLALEKGLQAHIKITDSDLKSAWTNFHPEVQASIIVCSSEADAKKVLAEVKKSGADFAKITKAKSTDTKTKADGGKVKFDSTSKTIPADVMTAAWKLKDGGISDVITATDASTYATSYYIIKMDKQSEKGNDMTKFKDQLTKIAKDAKLQDQTFVTKVIGEELKSANVKIEDDAFKSVLADFTGESKSSTSSKAATSSSTKK